MTRNLWKGLGKVAQDLHRGRMRNGQEAASFQITAYTANGGSTWVRVNVFEEHLLRYAKNRIKKGKDVYIEGELMNRRLGNKVKGQEAVEIRAFDLRVIRSSKARQIWKRSFEDDKEKNYRTGERGQQEAYHR